MANRSASGLLQVSGVDVEAYDVSGVGTINTDWVEASGDSLFLFLELVESGGTSPTLAWTVQASPNDGTSICDFPDDRNSSSQATGQQFSGTGGTLEQQEYWLNPFPHGAGWKWRVQLVTAGTPSTYTLTAWFASRNNAEEIS